MSTKTLSGVYLTTYDLTSPVTTLSITATGSLGAGIVAVGTGRYTIVNDGDVYDVSNTNYDGISLGGSGVITNAGTIRAVLTTKGAGVITMNGGTVTNEAGGFIEGYYGVAMGGASGTVNNAGTIFSTGKAAIELAGGGVVDNGSTTTPGGVIIGAIGVDMAASGTIHNYGNVYGEGSAGIGGYLDMGGLVVNGTAKDTSAEIIGTAAGMALTGAAGTILNYGLIRGLDEKSVGAAVAAGGTIVNGSSADTTATIESGAAAIEAVTGYASIANFGLIQGGYYIGTPFGAGIYLQDGGAVTNGTGVDKTATIRGSVGVLINKAPGRIQNFATIGGTLAAIGAAIGDGGTITNGSAGDTTAIIEGYIGAATETEAGTVINFGTILGRPFPGGFGTEIVGGVVMEGGGKVTNGSAADTKALVTGEAGIYGGASYTVTVQNFATLQGSLAGVLLDDGGIVTNGSASDTTAMIDGDLIGVALDGKTSALTNFGTILGGFETEAGGASLSDGGLLTNGSTADRTALIKGNVGAEVIGGALTNFATIEGLMTISGFGAVVGMGSEMTNEAGATVEGFTGVSISSTATVSNFGTILGGSGGAGVQMTDDTSRLNLESGSTLKGVVEAYAGLVDAISGTTTLTALDSSGKVAGAGTIVLDGGVSTFDTGIALQVKEIEVAGSTTGVDIDGVVSDAEVWDQKAGILTAATGDSIVFKGAGDSFSGTLGGAGKIEFGGGSDTLSAVTVSGAAVSISTATVTLSGAIDLAANLTVTTPHLLIATTGATLEGTSDLVLSNTATNAISGVSASARLVNQATIRGSGKISGLSLVNDGLIESGAGTGLTISTGANTVVNGGTIEALAAALTIDSAVDNTGSLVVASGTLTLDSALTGNGSIHITGGEAKLTGAVAEGVTFGAAGELALADSQAFTGSITTFSKTGSTSLDLEDIKFGGGTTATYSGTTTSGVLTVTDGTHTAKIKLIGNYLSSTWTVANDGSGGTLVKDPTAPAPTHATPVIQASLLADAAAGMGAPGASHGALTVAHTGGVPLLASPQGMSG